MIKNTSLSNLIDDIRNSTNIVDVISHYIALKKKGSSYFGLCPFHPDTHPSLSISPKKKIWKCFVCGAKGDVFSFVSKYEKTTYLEAVKKVAELTNYDLNGFNFNIKNAKSLSPTEQRLVQANVRANEFYTGVLYNDENKPILDYLHKRGLNEEIIKKFNIGYAVNDKYKMIDWLTNKDEFFGDNLPKHKVFNLQELFDVGIATETNDNKAIAFLFNRITFPIYDENSNLVGFSGRDWTGKSESKYSNTKETKIFKKGEILYNFNNIKSANKDFVIICEGFMDVIAYARAGYDNVVGTMGTAITSKHMALLQTLNNLKYVILSFDNDQAGNEANLSIGKQLFENGLNVSVVNYEGFKEKDADEILNLHGNNAIDKLIKTRVDYLTFKIICELPENISNDQKIICVNNLLSYLSQYGDTLLHDMHLDLISSRTKISKESLKTKLQEYLDKNKRSSSGGVNVVNKTLKPIKRTKSTRKITVFDLMYQQMIGYITEILKIILANPSTFDYITKRININRILMTRRQDKIYRLYKSLINPEALPTTKQLYEKIKTIIDAKIKSVDLPEDEKQCYEEALKELNTYMYDVEEGIFNYKSNDIDKLNSDFTTRSYNFLASYWMSKINSTTDEVQRSKYRQQLKELKENRLKK